MDKNRDINDEESIIILASNNAEAVTDEKLRSYKELREISELSK